MQRTVHMPVHRRLPDISVQQAHHLPPGDAAGRFSAISIGEAFQLPHRVGDIVRHRRASVRAFALHQACPQGSHVLLDQTLHRERPGFDRPGFFIGLRVGPQERVL
jgi:hypothetical protein